MTTMSVLHTTRVSCAAIATIPMPDPIYRLETTIQYGGPRGTTYIVDTDEHGGDARVYSAIKPRRRPMRSCGRRDLLIETAQELRKEG
jgi:hypothetical protein